MDYNYLEEVKNDVKEYINENYDNAYEIKCYYDNLDDFKEKLNNKLWNSDSVTGNASGSYYFNRYKAEEAICHNWDLIGEMLDEGYLVHLEGDNLDPEVLDVCLRCYVLSEAIDMALDELGIDEDTFEDEDFDDEYEDENEYHHYDSDDECGNCPNKYDCADSPYYGEDED